MLRVKVTENLGGINICGDFDDLNQLYESIYYLIDYDTKNDNEYLLQDHLYAFLYDVRHCYQGDWNIELFNNYLSSNNIKYIGIKKSNISPKNIYYSFNYLIPDAILDMIIIKYFINRKNDINNSNINFIKYFYSLIMETLTNILTKQNYNETKYTITNTNIDKYTYNHLWYERISINYSKMSKTKRKKEFMNIINQICKYNEYEGYKILNKDLKKYKKEKQNIKDIHYDDYIDNINW